MERKSIKQRVFAAFLAATMVFTMTPMTSYAEEKNTDTVSEEIQGYNVDSESIEALHSRIKALPTVEEFQAMADVTTVEGSTLNQAQLDVYNEAQSIAEEIDKLTDEEQGQLDTEKLEALFEYFNGMTEETTAIITPSLVSSDDYYINSGGTYTLSGGTYYSSYNSIVIETKDAVTLNIDGDITATTSESAFIRMTVACSNLTINGNGHTINETGGANALKTYSGSVTYLNNVTITGLSNTYPVIGNNGVMYLQSGNYSATGSAGQVFSNNGTLYIQGTTKITNVEGTNDAVANGNVYMTGGTVSAPNGGAIRNKEAGVMKITGGTISGSKYGVYVKENNPDCIIGNVTFSGNTNDVYLGRGQKFTLNTDYTGTNAIKVGVADTVSANTQRQITTTGTDQSVLAKVTSVNSTYVVNYDTSSKYLYLWKHAHTWSYLVSGNTITAKCTSDSNCDYYSEGLTAKLNAPDMIYTGSAYDKAEIENNITSVTEEEAGKITYVGRGKTSYTESATAPTDAGTYSAKVKIGGAIATADFTIIKADITPAVTLDNWVYGGTTSTPKVTGNSGNGIISYFYKKRGEADTEYKSITEADFNTIPSGEYTLKASVAEGLNYNAATAECDFVVAKQLITVSVSMDDWTYGEEAKAPSVIIKAEDSDITSSYEKSQITYTYYIDSECKNEVVPKNAGTYYVKAEVEATYNYFDGSAVAKFTIAKKAVTATVTADSKTYDGTTNAVVSAVVSDSDLISGDTITITGITGIFKNPNAGTDKKVTVDSSNAKITGTGVENYNIKIGTEAKASINKLTAEFKWSNTDHTYTGSEQSVTAKVSNAISGDEFTLTYDGNKQTKVGNYTAQVTALGNDNYKLPKVDKAQTAWKISYLTKGTVKVSGTKGDNDWYVTKVKITPETGYEISANGTDWKALLEYDAQGSQTAVYYLRETTTGFVSNKKTADFKIDTKLPTGEIKIKDNGFKEFLNTITFNHFFKNTVDVTITGTDTTSGIAMIEYQKVAKGASFNKDATWTKGESFFMTANDKSTIYARITDNAGQSVIINSDGIVVYTDATAKAKETFTRTSTADITTGITVNGNTIASVMIKNVDDASAETTQVDTSDYEIKDDKLVLKASYLRTLATGKYTFTVSYNPYGEAYTADSKGDTPATSVISFTVVKAEGSITNISDISKVHDGNAVAVPKFTTTNDRGTDDVNVTIEYKKQGEYDDTYTSEAPKDCGKYVVRISVKADENYESVSATKEFSIHKKEMKISADGYTGTYDGQAHGITVNVTEPADSAASNVNVVYGTKGADGNVIYSENPITYKDAGEYTVYYKVTADNYEDVMGSAVVKITPKTVRLVWSDTEFTYDGQAHKPSANVNPDDVIGSDRVEVTVTGEQTNAGSCTAQAAALSNGNYILGADVRTAFAINKAKATVTVDDATKHIGKDDPIFTYKVTGLVTGESLKDITVARTEGEAAGRYDITATAKEGSNANYDMTFVAGKLTIEDHIKAETPVIENRVEAGCTEGSYDEVYYCTVDDCKAELERVTKTIPAIGHSWSEWKEIQAPTATTYGKKKSVCKVCGVKRYESIPATGKPQEDSSNGKLEKEVQVAPTSPVQEATMTTSKSELLDAPNIFTETEKNKIEDGKVDAIIWLEINKTDLKGLREESKAKVKKEAEKIMGDKASDITYFDADLFKQVTDAATGEVVTPKEAIHEPGKHIEVTVKIPEKLLIDESNKSIVREYKIIRIHTDQATGKDVVDILDGDFNEKTGEFSFATDKFSTYAIAFTDVTVEIPADAKESDTIKENATKTGDDNTAWPFVVVMFAGVTLIVLVFGKKKKENR